MAELTEFKPLDPPAAAGEPEWRAIREAALSLVFESGPDGATVEALVERAGITRARFDQLFRDREDCLLQVYVANLFVFEELAFAAYNSHHDWRDGIRAAAYATANYMRDHLDEVSFGPVIRPFMGGEMEVRYEQMLHRLVDLVDAGRQQLEDPDARSRVDAESVLGAVNRYINKGLQDGARYPTVEEIVPQLMFMAVRPYFGDEIAQEELTIPPPAKH